MRSTTVAISYLALALAAPLAGCGDDRMERGLAAPDEEAVPTDPADLAETADQRAQQELGEDAAKTAEEFEAEQKQAD